MNTSPKFILNRITEYIAEHSGFEDRRKYLSLSHISECPRKAVREYMDGFDVEAHTHRMAFAGYEHERSLITMLTDLGLLERVNVEVAAPFDERLRGHLDGIWRGNVIEIKSVNDRQYRKVVEKSDKVLWKHFVQVQMYMRYAELRNAFVIYRNRETYEHMVIGVPYIQAQADKFEERARHILAAIDDNRLPECECGRCRETEHA